MNRSLARSFLGLLATCVVSVSTASAQTVVYSESFENGIGNWTATGFWHAQNDTDPCGYTASPFPEGRRCAYYGLDTSCNYDSGFAPNSGDLTLTNPVTLPTGFNRLSLHAWMLNDTEACDPTAGYFDQSDILVSTDGGTTWTNVARRCQGKFGSPNFWNPRAVDLTSYAGQSILIRFHFDTIDFFSNTTRGIFLDDVTIQGESGSTFCTAFCPCGGPYNFQSSSLHEGGISGCRNSTRASSELAGQGTASVSADSLVLNVVELPDNSMALLVQGSAFSAGAFNGEGWACLTGPVMRLAVAQAPAGVARFPAVGAPSLSVSGLVPAAGGTRHYQVRYRDSSTVFCNASNYNWTNGYTIVWTP